MTPVLRTKLLDPPKLVVRMWGLGPKHLEQPLIEASEN